MACQVCGCSDVEPHFGALSCRACAAFFRRYFHSKKVVGQCNCAVRFRNSHPCRECRIKKCLSIGMNPEKVQEKRERHPPKKNKPPSISEALTSSSSTPPSLPISQLPSRIIPRDCSSITLTAFNWQKCQPKRNYMTRTLDETNYYQLSCFKIEDCMMIWRIVEDLFPSLTWNLRKLDKEALLRNFLPKWSVLTAAIDMEVKVQRYSKVNNTEEFKRMIVDFFTYSMPEKFKMPPEDILKVFGPMIVYYVTKIILPIHEKGLDQPEFMALALIILFDGAYSNISVECSEMCRTIRNLIFRELKNYQTDKNFDEIQFADTVDTLNIVEKGEKKFYEELLICDMHNVHLHEDYRLLLNELNG